MFLEFVVIFYYFNLLSLRQLACFYIYVQLFLIDKELIR